VDTRLLTGPGEGQSRRPSSGPVGPRRMPGTCEDGRARLDISCPIRDEEERMAGMVPEDVYALAGAADPRLSPDGRTVAFSVWSIDKDSNEYRGAIWTVPLDGSRAARKFTSGEKRDGSPRWSPDGSRLVFTSKRDGEHMDLYVIPADGGEPVRLTKMKDDVTEPEWSPDGSRIAFISRVPDPAYEEK